MTISDDTKTRIMACLRSQESREVLERSGASIDSLFLEVTSLQPSLVHPMETALYFVECEIEERRYRDTRTKLANDLPSGTGSLIDVNGQWMLPCMDVGGHEWKDNACVRCLITRQQVDAKHDDWIRSKLGLFRQVETSEWKSITCSCGAEFKWSGYWAGLKPFIEAHLPHVE